MYVPSHFAEDPERIAEHLKRWPFAVVFTSGSLGPYATHVPLVLAGPRRLVGHVARANPHHRDLSGPGLAVFSGPHALVRSDWYDAPEQHVPTWNYLAIHAVGTLRVLPDPAEVLDQLMSTLQPSEQAPSSSAERERLLQGLSRAIVAFELLVERFEAKAKLSQNHSPENRARVQAALLATGDPMDAAVAREMALREDRG